MKSFKYTINGNVYKVHINSVVDDIADVEVNGTPYQVKLEKPAKKQMVTLKRPAQAPTTASGDPVVTRPAASTTQGAVKTPLPGVILQVKCNVGDTVKRGQTLIILEAMKMENNIYMQTGLIMIIGLLAKTAILLTEYAGKRRSEGMTLAQAAYSAAKVRLRPILMTVLSMVFGLVPLMMAHGVGANGSRSLATGVIGGMIVGTLALLFLVPSLFIVFQYIQERVKHN